MSHKIAKEMRHTARASILINLTMDGRIEVKGIPNQFTVGTEMLSAAQKAVYGYYIGKIQQGKFDAEKGEVIPDAIVQPTEEQIKMAGKVH